MNSRLPVVSAAVVFCCLVAFPASAQDSSAVNSGPPPANLAHVEGAVDLVHQGLAERAVAPALLLDGDIVRTGNGRAEIVFADGTVLHLDHDTELELLSPERVRVLSGRVMLRVSAATPRYVIDTPAASVRLDARGEYGITTDARRGSLDVTVARGVAEIQDNGQRIVVRAGERLWLAGPGARGLIEPFNTARWDAFDRWSNDRVNGFTTAASSRQLPYELRAYGPVLDQYGRWDYVAPHGYVWFPSVGASWRPYYDGSWTHTRYGWTWLGHDRWAWPTHHYGRWGYNGNFWYWIPAKTWGAAWVTWAFAPGYVSWCPLGWDGYPVAGFWGRPGDHPAYWPNYTPWRAWTVVPRDRFGPRRAVRTHAVDGDKLDEATRKALVLQNTPPPMPVGNAVPRGTLSAPGAIFPTDQVAVPRTSIDEPRRGNVRRPTADVPSFAAGDATVMPQNPPQNPTRRLDDPPAIYPAPAASEPDAGYRRRPPERESVPAYAPPPESSPKYSGDRGGKPDGGVQSRDGAQRRDGGQSRGGESRDGAQSRGGDSGGAKSAPAGRAPAASDAGGAARRRPGK